MNDHVKEIVKRPHLIQFNNSVNTSQKLLIIPLHLHLSLTNVNYHEREARTKE